MREYPGEGKAPERKTPQCLVAHQGRPQEYPGAERPQKDRIPIPKRGMREYPGAERPQKNRTPLYGVGNSMGTKRGIAMKGGVQKERVPLIGAESFMETQGWISQKGGTPQERTHRGRPPDPSKGKRRGTHSGKPIFPNRDANWGYK